MKNLKNGGYWSCRRIAFAALSFGVLILLLGALIFFLLRGIQKNKDSSLLTENSSTVSSENSEKNNPPADAGNLSDATVNPPLYWTEGALPQSSSFLSAEEISALFRNIPQRGWSGTKGWKWNSCTGIDTDSRVIDRLYELNLIDPKTPVVKDDLYHSSHPRIPYETIENLYRETWGPFFMSRYEGLGHQGNLVDGFIYDRRTQLVYEESSHSYVHYNMPFSRSPDSSGDHFYARLISIERDDRGLYAYVRYACYDTEAGEYSIYGEKGGWVINWDDRRTILARGRDGKNYAEDENSVFNRLHEGYFDEYLPVYRVTFLPDESGTYWWWECMRTEEGKRIPEELLTGILPEKPAIQGVALPVLGEKDLLSSYQGMNLAYFEDVYFYVTLDGRMYCYAMVPGHEEVLTPAEKITSFSQDGESTSVLWEVYSSKEYPNGFGILLRNGTDGSVYHYYRLD